MTEPHIVQQGEHASSIAVNCGFGGIDPIWTDPANSALKQARANPHVLLPGDALHVPDITPKELSCATDARHCFRRRQPKLRLRLILKDEDGQPWGGRKYRLEAGSNTWEGNVAPDGLIDHPISPTCTGARLHLWLRGDPKGPGVRLELKIGHLDPAEADSGVRARLVNMGIALNDGDESSERLKTAVRGFQKRHSYPVTGRIDDQLGNQLVEAHGV